MGSPQKLCFCGVKSPSLTYTPPSLKEADEVPCMMGSGGFPEKSYIFLGDEGDRLLNNPKLRGWGVDSGLSFCYSVTKIE